MRQFPFSCCHGQTLRHSCAVKCGHHHPPASPMQSESHRGFFAAAFVSAESRAARVKARVKSNTHQTIRRSKRRRRGGGQTHRHRQTQTHVPQITPTSEKIQTLATPDFETNSPVILRSICSTNVSFVTLACDGILCRWNPLPPGLPK